MPVTIRKKGKCYSVRTPNKVHSKCTTKRNAKRQKRLLDAMEHNPNFRDQLRSRVVQNY